jgi:hypothetical protein
MEDGLKLLHLLFIHVDDAYVNLWVGINLLLTPKFGTGKIWFVGPAW